MQPDEPAYDDIRIAPRVCSGAAVPETTTLTWSPDDRRLFGAYDDAIAVWDARTGEQRQHLAIGDGVTTSAPRDDAWRIRLSDHTSIGLSAQLAPDGMLEDLVWCTGTAPALPSELLGLAPSRTADRFAIVCDGRVEIWPAEGTAGWWLGRVRAVVARDRTAPATQAQLAELHDRVTSCRRVRDARGGLEATSRLLLADDPLRGMVHVARAGCCHQLGDSWGEYFELWEAERLRRAGAPALDVEPELAGRACRLLELAFRLGLRDADDARLCNVASRAYHAACDAIRRDDHRAALAWLVDALSIRPQAVTYYHAARLLMIRRELELASWCFDQIERCAVDEQDALHASVAPAYVAALHAACRELATSRVARAHAR